MVEQPFRAVVPSVLDQKEVFGMRDPSEEVDWEEQDEEQEDFSDFKG
ncbi:hypothetical protein HY493_05665 [Candidatus Woesearchaeota archaeon]|nr:hypothetical protein [Candidatus Woesearchaeota archaeon]